MQKLDFIKNLEVIAEKLQSANIVKVFQTGFNNPTQAHNYGEINPLLFLSKSNHDQIKNDEKYSAILNSLNAQQIYTEGNLALLTHVFRPVQANVIIATPNAINFFNFHKALLTALKLAKEVLVSASLDSSFEESLNKGIIIFQIIIAGDGLETEKYIKIFTALQELIETISKIFKEEDQKPEIVLLDSGSDTNTAIKAGVETAKSLFLIFKEIWDYITGFKIYQQNQKNKVLLDSLSIRAEIKKKIEEKVLTEDEGKEYMHMIKTRADELIGLKVMPKQIVIETNQFENRKLLENFEGTKLLAEGSGESQ